MTSVTGDVTRKAAAEFYGVIIDTAGMLVYMTG